jgi:hypothetical protein
MLLFILSFEIWPSWHEIKCFKEQGTVLVKFCPAMEIHQNAII